MTATFFVQFIITVFGYIVLALSYFGIGRFCSHILRISFLSENKFFSLVWIGWAITLLLLQILNLFFSINTYLSIPILIFGLISAIKFIKKEFRSDVLLFLSKTYLVLLIVAILWIANLSMLTPTMYDSGLYHFTTIRWINETPIVLGLGNLHGRLAFNQSFFSYVAYLNLYPLFNHGYNIANSFLLLTLLAECLLYLSKYITPEAHNTNSTTANVVTIFFVPIIIYLALYSNISSPAPDIASSVLQILIFIYFIRVIDKKTFTPDDISQIIFILIISATAITIKLSNLFYVLSICIILSFVKLKSLYLFPKQIPLVIIKLMALPALIIFIWGLRGMLLSGCPAYPSTIGCVNVPWSVPIESVKNEANWAYSWARTPYQTPDKVLNSWDWLMPWFYRVIYENGLNRLTVVYPLFIFTISITVSFILFVRQPLSQKLNRTWFLVPIPILIGLFFWFLLAPDIRFAHSLFWILPIAATFILLKILETTGKFRNGIVLMMFFIINTNVGLIFVLSPYIFMNISTNGYMPIPVVTLIEKTTLSGLKVLSPAEGDQCWDSKIPCTPYFNDRLKFIDSNIFPEFVIGDAIN